MAGISRDVFSLINKSLLTRQSSSAAADISPKTASPSLTSGDIPSVEKLLEFLKFWRRAIGPLSWSTVVGQSGRASGNSRRSCSNVKTLLAIVGSKPAPPFRPFLVAVSERSHEPIMMWNIRLHSSMNFAKVGTQSRAEVQ